MTKMRNIKDMEIIEIMTPPGIVMYPWVFEKNPEPDDQGVNWFGIVLKFPKDFDEYPRNYEGDPEAELKEMRRQFMKAAKQGWPNGNDPDGGFTDDFGSPLRDGDKFDKANNKKRNEELMGHWYMSLKTKNQPGVVWAKKGALVDILSKEDFYPGCWAVGSGLTFPYENKGNEGVSTRLTNVCKIADGERIGGKPAAKEQFKKFGKGAPSRNDADDADELL